MAGVTSASETLMIKQDGNSYPSMYKMDSLIK